MANHFLPLLKDLFQIPLLFQLQYKIKNSNLCNATVRILTILFQEA